MYDIVIKEAIKKTIEDKGSMSFGKGYCASDVIDFLHSEYKVDDKEFEMNGWQMDFWILMKINGELFTLSGSGYYGRLCLEHTSHNEE